MRNILRTLNILNTEEKKKLIFFFLIVLFTALLEVIGVGLLFPLLNSVIDQKFLDKFNLIFSDKFFDFNVDIYFLLLFISTVLILKNLILVFFNWYNLSFCSALKSRVVSNTLKIFLDKNYDFFLENSNAIITRNVQNADKFQTFVLNLVSILSDLTIVIFLLILAVFIEPKILIPIFFICVISFLINFALKKYLVNKGEKKYQLVTEMHKWLLDSLNAIKEIKILSKESFFYRNFKIQMKKINYIERTARVANYVPRHLIEIFIIASFTSIFIFSMSSVPNRNEFIIFLGFVLLTILRIITPIGRILPSLQVIIYYKNEINTFLDDYEEFVQTNINKKNLLLAKKQNYLPSLHNKSLLFFDQVTFSYKNNNSLIFKNLNFIGQENKIVGIRGDSGVGKSTFLDLTLGLLMPNKGNIYSNGKNIFEDIVSWRNKIGYVSQNPYLLNDSLVQNVAFGNYYNEIDLEKVILSLRKSLLLTSYKDKEISDFIHSNVGENSRKLSGGQKQRLAIARVFYRNPQIVILDEATNALDEKNENELYKIIKDNRENKLIIIVSHKISNFKLCDDLYVIDNFNLKKI
jgi:ABC-type multidrug transport system fused ATPase/permease subunit